MKENILDDVEVNVEDLEKKKWSCKFYQHVYSPSGRDDGVECTEEFHDFVKFRIHLRRSHQFSAFPSVFRCPVKACKASNKVYNRRQNLQNHYDSVHKPDKEYECEICHKKLAVKRIYTRHVKRCKSPLVPCSYCDKKFTTHQSLSRHVKTLHLSVIQEETTTTKGKEHSKDVRLLLVPSDKFPELADKISEFVTAMSGSSQEPGPAQPRNTCESKRRKVLPTPRKIDNSISDYSPAHHFILPGSSYCSLDQPIVSESGKQLTPPNSRAHYARAIEMTTSNLLDTCTSRDMNTCTTHVTSDNSISLGSAAADRCHLSTISLSSSPIMMPGSVAVASAAPHCSHVPHTVSRAHIPLMSRGHATRWSNEPPRFMETSSFADKHLFSAFAQTDNYWGYNEFSTQTVGREHQSFGTQTIDDVVEDPDLDSFLVECLDGAVQTDNTNRGSMCFGSSQTTTATTTLPSDDFVPPDDNRQQPNRPYGTDRLDRHCQTNYYTNSTHTQTNMIRERALIVTDGLNIETQTLSCDPEDYVSSYNERFTQTTQSDGEEQFSIL